MVDNQAFDSNGEEKNRQESTPNVTDDDSIPEKPKEQALELKRKIGLFSAISLIVGNMIGSGIFITPGGVLRRSGSVGLSLVLWAVCGVLAIFGSLTYVELSMLTMKSGGEYAYFIDGLGHLHPFLGPLTAFLYSWIMILLLRPASFAAGCLSISSYTIYPILKVMDIKLEPDMEDLLMKLVAVICLTLIITLNSYSVSWTVRVANFLTVAKLMAIAILIGCGIYQLYLGQTQYLAEGFEGSTTDFGTIATGLYGGLWAYDGWNNLNYVTEELKNPYVTLPRAIIIGIPLVTFCYLAVNIAYLTVLSPEEMISSSAVAVDVGNRLLGPVAFIIPVAVVMSVSGSVLTTGFSIGRLAFASGREGHMVNVMSYIHVDSRTPVPALLFECILAIAFILAQDVASLIDFFTFTMWIFYVLAFILLLVLRKTRPDAPRPYKVPIVIPIIIIIIGCYLIVAPIISDPSIKYVYVLAVFFSGFLAYIPFVYYKYSFGFMVPLTRYIQLILNVGPTVKQ